MSENEGNGDEHLLIHVVTMFTQQAWMAMGKLKNPVTEKMERNLEEASFYIDIIDMMKKRMAGNLSDDEEKFLESSLSGLKMNYIEETNKPEPETPEEESPENEKDINTDEASTEKENVEEKPEVSDSGENSDEDKKTE